MLHGADADEACASGAPFAADDDRVVARGGVGDFGLHVHLVAVFVVVAVGGEGGAFSVGWEGGREKGMLTIE